MLQLLQVAYGTYHFASLAALSQCAYIGFTFVQPFNACPQANQCSLAQDVADMIQALNLTRFMDYAGYDDQALRS